MVSYDGKALVPVEFERITLVVQKDVFVFGLSRFLQGHSLVCFHTFIEVHMRS